MHTHTHTHFWCVCVREGVSALPIFPEFDGASAKTKASSTLFFNQHNLCSYFLHTQTVASGIFQKTEANIVLEFCL